MIKSQAFFEAAVEVQKWVERYNELKKILAQTMFFYCPNCGSSDNEHKEECSNPLDISKEQLEANIKTKILQEEFSFPVENDCKAIIIRELRKKPSGMTVESLNIKIKDYDWRTINAELTDMVKMGILAVTAKRIWLRDV